MWIGGIYFEPIITIGLIVVGLFFLYSAAMNLALFDRIFPGWTDAKAKGMRYEVAENRACVWYGATPGAPRCIHRQCMFWSHSYHHMHWRRIFLKRRGNCTWPRDRK